MLCVFEYRAEKFTNESGMTMEQLLVFVLKADWLSTSTICLDAVNMADVVLRDETSLRNAKK